GPRLGRGEGASTRDRNAEYVEEVRRDEHWDKRGRCVAPKPVHLGFYLIARTPGEPGGLLEPAPLVVRGVTATPKADVDELVGVASAGWLEEQRVREREDRRVDGDAEPDGKY